MKIRIAFVSNSSSTSSITLIPKSIHQEIISKLDEQSQDVFKCYSPQMESHPLFGGMDFVSIEEHSGNAQDCLCFDDEELKKYKEKYTGESVWDYLGTAIRNYFYILRKNHKGFYFAWSVSS